MRTKTKMIIGFGLSTVFLVILFLILIFSGKQAPETEPEVTLDQNRQPTRVLTQQERKEQIITQIIKDTSKQEPAPRESEEVIRDSFGSPDKPVVFLANKTPYVTEDFSIDYTRDEKGYIVFVVTVKTNIAQAQPALQEWLLSLGLTEESIRSLKFTYQ